MVTNYYGDDFPLTENADLTVAPVLLFFPINVMARDLYRSVIITVVTFFGKTETNVCIT